MVGTIAIAIAITDHSKTEQMEIQTSNVFVVTVFGIQALPPPLNSFLQLVTDKKTLLLTL